MADFLLQELRTVRHTSVTVEACDFQEQGFRPEEEEITGTVASVRLDSVISLAFSISRSSTAPLIEGGKVFVNGKLITDFPTNVLLDAAKPEVEMLDGWNCDISSCRNWNDLPENAKKYIERIEELIGHSIYLVSTGAKRDEYLLKE